MGLMIWPPPVLVHRGEWTPVTDWLNSWTHFGSGYPEVAYRKDGIVVRLRGLAKAPATTSASELFVLPEGFRPTGIGIFNANGNFTSGPASTGTAHTHTMPSSAGRIQVYTTGAVNLTGATVTAGGHLSLDGISFLCED
ncbi:hypothetical protein AVT26_gp24 [Streptomyces phage Lannister]|uniref:Uncharacterized protein n=1 Tax=Streptomyces phage Lannister TaxID=1674927 RepID=A0A0K1Y9D8_9CAUD|nr:hypothetical protein AVT26_gp24 [Streptomyces phage Lannister]AKY03706.1 hypothetical protein SEA_LANNISTER_24 [Streptomyces phage Lannister]